MPHKPLVFDIDDSCDDAPYDSNQAQPAFIIDIDDGPDLLPAEVACDNASVAPKAGSAVLSTSASPPPHATAQPHSAMPDHTKHQSALTTASVSAPRGDAQAAAAYAAVHVLHDMQQEQQRHPTQHDYMPSALGSPCLGLVSADAMTVPDTPPYSHASHAGSPIAPTWLSPMLTKQQPGQVKQYSPSMLGRPPGSHHHTESPQTHAAGFAGQLSSNLAGPRALQTPQLLSLHLPEEQQLPAAASVTAGVGLMHSQGGLRHNDQLHRQSLAARWLPGTVQASAATAEPSRSPNRASAAAVAAIGVGVARNNRQEVGCSDLPDAAAMPRMCSEPLQAGVQSHQRDSTSPDPAAQHSTNFGSSQKQPSWDAPQQAHHGHASAAALHPKPGTATHPTADAHQSAKLSRQLSRAEKQATAAVSSQLAPEMPSSAQAPIVIPAPLQTTASADTAAVCNQGAAAAVANTYEEGDHGATQQGSENADWAATDVVDDWDWQQSQLNLGFQDAFEASQGLGPTPDLSPAVTWAGNLKPAQAAQPASASGLPVKGIGQRQAQESSAAKHVPFSNRRIPLPPCKPPIRQHKAVQPDCEFLTVRRPMPGAESQQTGTLAKASAPSHAPTATDGVPSCAKASPHTTAKRMAGHLAQAAGACSSSTASPLAQAKAVCEGSCKPSGVLCSHLPRHDTTAAATDGSADRAVATIARPATRITSATPHLAADVKRCEPQEQTTHTHVANISGRSTASAAAGGGERNPSNFTGAAVGGSAHRQSPAGAATAAVPATSPAAAIFGPHIAGAGGSQSHAKKKLCLQLAPRQTTAVGPPAAVGIGPHQKGANPHSLQQPQARQGPAPAASAEVCYPPSSGTQRENSPRKSDGDNDGQGSKAAVNMKAACKEAKEGTAEEATASPAVLSPIGNSLAVTSPEAATPAGQTASQWVSGVCYYHLSYPKSVPRSGSVTFCHM